MSFNIQLPQNRISPHGILLTQYDSKDESHRLSVYIEWLQQTGIQWFAPDLTTYREYLLNEYNGREKHPLSPTSTKAHLSTVRARYRSILRSNKVRDYFFESTPADLSPSNRKALVDEIIERIRNAIDPENSIVKTVTKQDIHDEEHIRLTRDQVKELILQPDQTKIIGKRDVAILALLLCTGIREAELCALDVADLYKTFGGQKSIHIRYGKGSKERLIPYGQLLWGLKLTQDWLSSAKIMGGPVFRGFYKGGKRIRPTRLTVRAINQILDKYPIMINDELKKVSPHDLRRTYARQLYESGMDILAIRDNLGHVDSRTTLKYIGTMDVEARTPQNIYSLAELKID